MRAFAYTVLNVRPTCSWQFRFESKNPTHFSGGSMSTNYQEFHKEWINEKGLDLSETIIEYAAMEILFEWHFDVFGLIDKGLAIDINSLNYESK